LIGKRLGLKDRQTPQRVIKPIETEKGRFAATPFGGPFRASDFWRIDLGLTPWAVISVLLAEL
jgi:hypothetical protein